MPANPNPSPHRNQSDKILTLHAEHDSRHPEQAKPYRLPKYSCLSIHDANHTCTAPHKSRHKQKPQEFWHFGQNSCGSTQIVTDAPTGSPAHAGIDHGGLLLKQFDGRFPRTRGDRPALRQAHFRHAAGKDAHAPGFYLHLEPGACFAACGIWHPGGDALAEIRNAIIEDSASWTRMTQAKAFRDTFTLMGQSLQRPPRGCDAAHPLIDDLKRKDFVAGTVFHEADAIRPDFLQRFAQIARGGAAFVGFLSRAVGVSF